MKRRDFIYKSSIGGLLFANTSFPMHALIDDDNITKVTILHTNDVHSRIDPFPEDGSRNAGRGGVARRAAMIKKIRKEEENVLLFDSGDILQGTPYFNFYGGELEFKLMTEMGYDAGTMGNHDFDGGIDGFNRLMPLANFPFLVSNYNFKDTILNNKILDYKVFQKGGVKIGVFGLGIELEGLVPKTLYKETQYLDPINHANRVASHLKNELKCDYVICLSHLGYKYSDSKISDQVLARSSKNINLILGGHTHTFLNTPDKIKNLDDKIVFVNQAGFGGLLMGRIDLHFEKGKPGKCLTCENLIVS